jgi:hypothetical protein
LASALSSQRFARTIFAEMSPASSILAALQQQVREVTPAGSCPDPSSRRRASRFGVGIVPARHRERRDLVLLLDSRIAEHVLVEGAGLLRASSGHPRSPTGARRGGRGTSRRTATAITIAAGATTRGSCDARSDRDGWRPRTPR